MNKKEFIASALDTHLADKDAVRRAVLTAPAAKKAFWRPVLASAAALCACVAVALGILSLPREEPEIPVIPGVSDPTGTSSTTAPSDGQEDVVKYFNYFLKEQLSTSLPSSDSFVYDTNILYFCLRKLSQQTGREAFSTQELQEASQKYFGRTMQKIEPSSRVAKVEGADLFELVPMGADSLRYMLLQSLTQNVDGSKTAVFQGYAVGDASPLDFEWSDEEAQAICLSGNQRIFAARALHCPSLAKYYVLNFTEKEDENGLYLQYHSATVTVPAVPAPEGITMRRTFPLNYTGFGYNFLAADYDSLGMPTEFQEITRRPFTIMDNSISPPKLYDSFLDAAEQIKQEWKTDPATGKPLYLRAQLDPIFLTDSVCSFSIAGSANATDAPSPKNVYRTFTYDIMTGEQLRLADLCEISPQLVSLYRRRFREQAPAEQATLLDSYTDEQLLEELRNADQPGSHLQSYLTTDGIGIVFPNGDDMDQRIQTIL